MIQIPKQLQSDKIRFVKIRPKTKTPSEKDWVEGGNYRYTETQFKAYLKTATSYGIATGYNDLVVVDIEMPKENEDNSLFNLIISHQFPDTFTVQTGGGGRHLYYHIKGLKKRIVLANDETHYGEVLAKGNQCIGPGSLHESGNKYVITNPAPIKTITKEKLLELLKKYIKEEEDTSNFVNNSVSGLNWDISKLIDHCPGLKSKNEVKWQGPHPVHGSEGGQNFEIDTEKNTWYCFRCGCGGDAVNLVAMLEHLIDTDESCPSKKHFREVFIEAKKLGIKKYGFPDDNYKPKAKSKISTDNIPDLFVYNEKGKIIGNNIREIVEYFKAHNPTIVIESITGKGAHIYVYQNGFYQLGGQQIISDFVKTTFNKQQKLWTSGYENEIIKYISTLDVKSRSEFKTPINLINCSNVTYNLDTRKTHRHSPNDYFLYKIPWNFKANLPLTPDLKKYFNSTFSSNPEILKFIQELFGYCLYMDYCFAGLFYLYGTGGNGKKVFMALMEQMLGEKNIANKSINSLVSNRFATANLYGKLLNSCGELSGRTLKETDMLKRLTSGDRIEAEFKGLDGFDFETTAKIVTSCNSIPSSYDDTPGWYDRQFIIPFLQKFRFEKAEDTKLIKKLITKKNMESLLSWSIQGLHRLLENEGFSYPKNRKEIYFMYQQNTQYFLKTNYERTFLTADYVKIDDVRAEYKKWCSKNNVPLDSDESLARAFNYVFKKGKSDPGPSLELISEDNEKIYVRRGMKKVK